MGKNWQLTFNSIKFILSSTNPNRQRSNLVGYDDLISKLVLVSVNVLKILLFGWRYERKLRTVRIHNIEQKNGS